MNLAASYILPHDRYILRGCGPALPLTPTTTPTPYSQRPTVKKLVGLGWATTPAPSTSERTTGPGLRHPPTPRHLNRFFANPFSARGVMEYEFRLILRCGRKRGLTRRNRFRFGYRSFSACRKPWGGREARRWSGGEGAAPWGGGAGVKGGRLRRLR